jgi:hypothetical protein
MALHTIEMRIVGRVANETVSRPYLVHDIDLTEAVLTAWARAEDELEPRGWFVLHPSTINGELCDPEMNWNAVRFGEVRL